MMTENEKLELLAPMTARLAELEQSNLMLLQRLDKLESDLWLLKERHKHKQAASIPVAVRNEAHRFA